jgi:tRNA dimethylallyltransferase
VAKGRIRPEDARPLLALVGPTASGKTAASIPVALAIGSEIVGLDSTNVYHGIDVGTAKPSPEERAAVPHHLLDLVEPGEPFSAARFQALAREAVAEIRSRSREPLLVGGSGLYYRAVVDGLRFPGTAPRVRGHLEAESLALGPEGMHRRLAGLDPVAAARIEPANVRRTVRALEVVANTGLPFSSFGEAWNRYRLHAVIAAGIDVPREVLHRRIEARAARIMPALMAETEVLLGRGHRGFIEASQIIGYAEAMACIDGKIGMDEALQATVRRSKALARRQMAWFRRDPRVRWFGVGDDGAAAVVPELIAYFRDRLSVGLTDGVPGATMTVEA